MTVPMGAFLSQLTIVLVAGTIIVNGASMDTSALLEGAKDTANTANVRQLSTALELYYLDHNAYPTAQTGPQLVNTLYTEGYIQNRPLDSTVFAYEQKSGGNEYTLKKK